jgi:hypothetical protein
MTTMFTKIVASGSPASARRGKFSDELRRGLAVARAGTSGAREGGYTVSPSIAAGRIEVVTMPDVTAIVFVVDDDISVRESLELLIQNVPCTPPWE